MKEDKLKYLKQILDTLDSREKTVLHDYLTSFDSRGKGYKPKTLILYQLLLKYPDIEDVHRLFKKKMPSEDAMRMTIFRLKEKIGESLLLDINIAHEDNYDEISRARVEVAKKKLVALIYTTRGLKTEVLDIYNKVVSICKKYELYSDLTEVLNLQQQALGLKHGRKEFEKLDAEIGFYENCRSALLNARKVYHSIILNYGFKGLSRGNTNKDYETELEQVTNKLYEDYQATSSGQVGYYYHLLMIEYNQVKRNIAKASEYCQLLVETVKENPSVYHRRRLGIAYLNYSQNELFNFDFVSAAEKAIAAKEFFVVNSPNHSLAMELEFYAYFYNSKIDDAESAINQLLSNEKLDKKDFFCAKLNYLLACVHFVKGQYNKVILALQEAHRMDKDREGWNVGIRLLTILYAIDNEQFDYADSLIINLRQFIKEALKEQTVRERDKTILDILLNLRKSAYDFKEAAKAKATELERLSEDSMDYGWEMQSPELILFQQWFENRLLGHKYQPVFEKEKVYQ